MERDLDQALTGLLNRQLDFDLIDSRGLRDCRVANGTIATACEQFQLLAAMDTGDFSAEVLRIFEQLAEQGGRLLFLQGAAVCSSGVMELLRRYPDRVSAVLPKEAAAVAAGFCEPVLKTAEEAPFLWIRRCRKAEEDDLLLHCRDGQKHTVKVIVELDQRLLVCDPLSGREQEVPLQNGSAELTVPAKSGLVIRLFSRKQVTEAR